MTGSRFGWLVSYPKSGNTWIRLLLDSLLQGGRPVDINAMELRSGIATRSELDNLIGMESSALTEAEIEALQPALFALIAKDFNGPLILRKVHDRCWLTHRGERVFGPALSVGAVYIARDPRDVAVSAAHFYGISLDESIDRMADPARVISKLQDSFRPQLPQPLGTWSDHVLSWLNHSEMPVHLVRYEDLKADTAGELRKVATFLRLDPQHAEAAAQATDFKTLQEQESKNGFRERKSTCQQFFRQGCAGGWRNALATAQADRIVTDHGEVMHRLGYL